MHLSQSLHFAMLARQVGEEKASKGQVKTPLEFFVCDCALRITHELVISSHGDLRDVCSLFVTLFVVCKPSFFDKSK